jgi:hypothetical protein
MRKAFLLTVAALAMAAGANAQERFAGRPHTETTQSVSLTIPFGTGLHYAYEHPLGRRITLVERVGADAGAAWGTDWFGNDSFILAIIPSIDIEPRFYYGLDRRAAHGRSTAGNSGSFLALQMKTLMPFGYISDSSLTSDGAIVLTPMWGLRRAWGEHWRFEFTTGFSHARGWKGDSTNALHLAVRFGYSF